MSDVRLAITRVRFRRPDDEPLGEGTLDHLEAIGLLVELTFDRSQATQIDRIVGEVVELSSAALPHIEGICDAAAMVTPVRYRYRFTRPDTRPGDGYDRVEFVARSLQRTL